MVALAGPRPNSIIVGIGESVAMRPSAGAVTYVRPFDSSEALINDLPVAAKLLQHAIREASRGLALRPAPFLVLHPTHRLGRNLTASERASLIDLGDKAGARRSFVWEGPELSDSELRRGAYKNAI
jgi:hypothetical protein